MEDYYGLENLSLDSDVPDYYGLENLQISLPEIKATNLATATEEKKAKLAFKTPQEKALEKAQQEYLDVLNNRAVSDEALDTFSGQLSNIGSAIMSGARTLAGTVLQAPSAAIEAGLDTYYADTPKENIPAYMKQFMSNLSKQTDDIQEWGKGWQDLVNRTDINKANEELKYASDLVVDKWNKGDKGGAIADAMTNLVGYIIANPGATLTQFAESLPNTAAMLHPVSATAAFSGYSTEALDEGVEAHREKYGTNPDQAEMGWKALLALGIGASESLGDLAQAKILKSLIKQPVTASGVVSGTALGLGKATGEVATEAAQGATTSALEQAIEAKQGERLANIDPAEVLFEGTLEGAAASPYAGAEVVKGTKSGIKSTKETKLQKAQNKAIEDYKATEAYSPTETEISPTEAIENLSETSTAEDITKVTNTLIDGNQLTTANADSINKIIEDNDLDIPEEVETILDEFATKPEGILKKVVKGTAKATVATAEGTASAIKKGVDFVQGQRDPVIKEGKKLNDALYEFSELEDLDQRAEKLDGLKVLSEAKRLQVPEDNTRAREYYDELIEDINSEIDTTSKLITKSKGGVKKDVTPESTAQAYTNLTENKSKDVVKDKDIVLGSMRLGSFPFNEDEVNKLLTNTELSKDDSFVKQVEAYKTLLTYKDVAEEIATGKDQYWRGFNTALEEVNSFVDGNQKNEAETSLGKLANHKNYQEAKVKAFREVALYNQAIEQGKPPPKLTNVEPITIEGKNPAYNKAGLIVGFKVAGDWGKLTRQGTKDQQFYFGSNKPSKVDEVTFKRHARSFNKLLNENVVKDKDFLNATYELAKASFDSKFGESRATTEPSKKTSTKTNTTSTQTTSKPSEVEFLIDRPVVKQKGKLLTYKEGDKYYSSYKLEDDRVIWVKYEPVTYQKDSEFVNPKNVFSPLVYTFDKERNDWINIPNSKISKETWKLLEMVDYKRPEDGTVFKNYKVGIPKVNYDILQNKEYLERLYNNSVKNNDFTSYNHPNPFDAILKFDDTYYFNKDGSPKSDALLDQFYADIKKEAKKLKDLGFDLDAYFSNKSKSKSETPTGEIPSHFTEQISDSATTAEKPDRQVTAPIKDKNIIEFKGKSINVDQSIAAIDGAINQLKEMSDRIC